MNNSFKTFFLITEKKITETEKNEVRVISEGEKNVNAKNRWIPYLYCTKEMKMEY